MALAAFASLAVSAVAHADRWRIEVEETAVYRVAFEALAAAEPIASDALRLESGGRGVPIEVRDGDDGLLGPGDDLVFVGERLTGESTWHHPYAARNVYHLSIASGAGERFAAAPPVDALAGPEGADVTFHREAQERRIVIPGVEESWFWDQRSVLSRDAFLHTEARPASADPARPVQVHVGLQGVSESKGASAAGLPQHQVQLSAPTPALDSGKVGESGQLRDVSMSGWDGRTAHVSEIEAGWTGDAFTLQVDLVRRTLPESGNPIIDVVLVDWIELNFAWSGQLDDGRATIAVPDGGPPVDFLGSVPDGTVAYGENGELRTTGGLPTGTWHIVSPDGFATPALVEASEAPPATGDPVDYLVVVAPSLFEAVAPLAAHHRAAGLAVRTVTTEQVYEAAGDGISSPEAIRHYLAREYARSEPARLRYVLLVGDASWDSRGWRHDTARAQLPTWQGRVGDSVGASDNPYADLAENDGVPEIAVGRLPISEPERLRAAVDKIIAAASTPPVGDWRRRAVWITGEEAQFQRISDGLGELTSERGFTTAPVYSTGDPEDTAAQQARIASAFAEGAALVHFLGHGGRFIWRTGAPDLASASDLFGLDQVAALAPTRRLPILLSMTCTSGPFDHPTEGSLAEQFLALPDRGAIAVVAASWRIPASEPFSRAIVDALTVPGATVGEALLAAKRAESNRALVASYNLLGDPASTLPPAE